MSNHTNSANDTLQIVHFIQQFIEILKPSILVLLHCSNDLIPFHEHQQRQLLADSLAGSDISHVVAHTQILFISTNWPKYIVQEDFDQDFIRRNQMMAALSSAPTPSRVLFVHLLQDEIASEANVTEFENGDVYEQLMFHQSYLLQRVCTDYYVYEHLLLMPSPPIGRLQTSIRIMFPGAMVAVFRYEDSENSDTDEKMIEVWRVAHALQFKQWFAAQEFLRILHQTGRPKRIELPSISKMPLCVLSYMHQVYRLGVTYDNFDSLAITTSDSSAELGILDVLEERWLRCFELSLLYTDVLDRVTVFRRVDRQADGSCRADQQRRGPAIDHDLSPNCGAVTLNLYAPVDRRITTSTMLWSQRQYVMLVPNWWRRRTGRHSSDQNRRALDVIIAVLATILFFILLIVFRYKWPVRISSTTTESAVSYQPLVLLSLDTWARSLAVSMPSHISWDISLLASVWGMWNGISMTGAIFELRLAEEWAPVFQTVADVRDHGVGLRLLCNDRLFTYHLPHWNEVAGLDLQLLMKRNRDPVEDRRNYMAIIVPEGVELEFVDWRRKHAGNGSRVYRKLNDPSLSVNVHASVFPRWLNENLEKVASCLQESGISLKLLDFELHKRRLKHLHQQMFNDRDGDGDDGDSSVEMAAGNINDLLSVWYLHSLLLALATLIWLTEMMVHHI